MPVMKHEQLTLASLHRSTLGRVVVIVTEDMQHTVNNEQRQFVVDSAGVLWRLACGDRRTDHDVAQQ